MSTCSQDRSGRVIYHGAAGELEVAREGPHPSEDPRYKQIPVPRQIYDRVHDQQLEVRLDYLLTLFGLDKSFSLRALNGDARTSDWGWCQTKVNDPGTAVMLHCMKPGNIREHLSVLMPLHFKESEESPTPEE